MTSSRPDTAADVLPPLEELRHPDPRISAPAWQRAFPVLWQTALRFLPFLLAGPQHAVDREDLAARAVSELVRGVVENHLPSFHRMQCADDVLDMLPAILRARTKDFFRARGRRPEKVTDVIPEPAFEKVGEDPALTWEELSVLIARLPSPQPEIFHRHYAQGHTADEIAGQLSLPRSTVLSHLFRGRQTLRAKLDGRAAQKGGQPASP